MSKAAYIGVDGIAEKVKSIYIGVNGTAQRVTKAYIGDANGVARQWYSAGGGSRVPDGYQEVRYIYLYRVGSTVGRSAFPLGNSAYTGCEITLSGSIVCQGRATPPEYAFYTNASSYMFRLYSGAIDSEQGGYKRISLGTITDGVTNTFAVRLIGGEASSFTWNGVTTTQTISVLPSDISSVYAMRNNRMNSTSKMLGLCEFTYRVKDTATGIYTVGKHYIPVRPIDGGYNGYYDTVSGTVVTDAYACAGPDVN